MSTPKYQYSLLLRDLDSSCRRNRPSKEEAHAGPSVSMYAAKHIRRTQVSPSYTSWYAPRFAVETSNSSTQTFVAVGLSGSLSEVLMVLFWLGQLARLAT